MPARPGAGGDPHSASHAPACRNSDVAERRGVLAGVASARRASPRELCWSPSLGDGHYLIVWNSRDHRKPGGGSTNRQRDLEGGRLDGLDLPAVGKARSDLVLADSPGTERTGHPVAETQHDVPTSRSHDGPETVDIAG